MKKTKRILAIILGLLSIACFGFSAACSNKDFDPTKVDKTPTGSTGLVFEYMTDAEIPYDAFTEVTEQDVNDGKVTYVFTSPEYAEKGETKENVYYSNFPGVFCDVVGEWRVTVVKGNVTKTKTFEVKDTIKPEFEVQTKAYDVWFDAVIGENGEVIDEGTKYTLPMIFPNDLSEFDYDTYEQTLTLDTDLSSEDDKIIDIKILSGDRYTVPATGKLTYTITIADIYGNSNTYTTSWNVKDPTWVDTSLPEGYLATYDKDEYVNSVYSGDMSSYWFGSEISEEFLTKDEFTAETGVSAKSGVVKVSAAPTDGYAVGAFGFRLSKSLVKEDTIGKYLIVKFYTPNNVETVRFGCKTWQTKGNPSRPVEAVHSIVVDVVPGEWNYAIISQAQLNEGYFSLGDTEISEYQIAFGERTTSVPDKEIVLYVDEVALADQLPDITGFDARNLRDGGVISWDNIDGADYYEVIDDGVKKQIRRNYYFTEDLDKVITVRAISENARYISAPYATTFINTANFGEHDLALFDSKSYETIVTKSERSERKASSVTAEVLGEYQGEQNVLKVTTVTKDGGIGDFRMKLPKSCEDGITVKFMIKNSPANFFYWVNPSLSEVKSISDSANVLANQDLGDLAGKWQIVYIPYGSSETVKDVIEVLVLDNKTKAEGGVTEVYFADVLSGDRRCDYKLEELAPTTTALAEKLTGSMLADFSSKDYEKLAVIDTYYNNHIAESVTAEYVQKFKGYTDLLKVTTLNNSASFGNFTLYLPKAMGENGYTVRFYLETTSNAALRIGNPHTEIAPGTGDILKEYYPLSLVNGLWTEVYVPYTGEHTQEITFQIWGDANGVNNFYFDYVADGNVVNEMAKAREQAIIDALPEGYLADFSSEIYESYIMLAGSPNTASSIKAEYLESYTDASGIADKNVMKVTATAAGNGRGNVVIKLPKASASGKMTIKYMIPECNSTYNGFIDPGTNASLITAQISQSNTWQYMVLNQASYEKDLVELLFANGGAVTNVVYIACIVEGDQVQALKNEALKNIMTDLAEDITDEKVLADFSSKGYEQLASLSSNSTNAGKSITAEYLSSYEGKDGVLKVTTVSNSRGNMIIYLPKANTSGKITITYMVTQGSVTMWFLTPGQVSAAIKNTSGQDANVTVTTTWQTVTIDYSAYAPIDHFEILFANSKGATNIAYFAEVRVAD